jgi:hypothetical protein
MLRTTCTIFAFRPFRTIYHFCNYTASMSLSKDVELLLTCTGADRTKDTNTKCSLATAKLRPESQDCETQFHIFSEFHEWTIEHVPQHRKKFREKMKICMEAHRRVLSSLLMGLGTHGLDIAILPLSSFLETTSAWYPEI